MTVSTDHETGASQESSASERMLSLTRRECLCLASSAIALGAAAHAGQKLAPAPASGFGATRALAQRSKMAIRDHRVTVAATTPKLVIAHGKSPARNLRAALERMGGLGQWILPGESVLIKPNAAWEFLPIYAATTHPELVAELVRACRDARAGEVVVTDCPVDDPERAFDKSGILKAAREAGARVILPADVGRIPVQLPGTLGTWPVLEPFFKAAKVINLPIAKHHGSSRVTAGMKNWIGITDKDRNRFHTDLHGSIAALASAMRPTLTIVDASRILMRNGPRGGNLDDVRAADALAISTDPVAVDAWATELLQARVSEVKYLKAAVDRGLGQLDYRKLAVEVNTG